MTSKFYKQLKENNKTWVREKTKADPDFFKKLAEGQAPKAFVLGCGDSRVPLNDVLGADAGEIFVQRNIANMVVHSDIDMLSVLEFAVNVLEVPHVIVCGHYGCGGVKAAMDNKEMGLIDNWLGHIKDTFRLHREEIDAIPDEKERYDRCVELNVKEQVYNMATTTIVQKAWENNQDLTVHGWVYDLKTGLINDLEIDMDGQEALSDIYRLKF